MHEENYEEEGGEECMHCHTAGPMKKEFKLAMLEKKEKIMQAKLEFIKKMKELVKKIPEPKK